MIRAIVTAAIIAVCLVQNGQAADMSQAEESSKSRTMPDEPMATDMSKEGMMKSDVEKAAARKAKEMQQVIEQEEQSMPQEKDSNK